MKSLALPSFVFIEDAGRSSAVEPGVRLGVVLQMGFPIGGADGKDGAVEMLLALCLSGGAAFGEGEVAGAVKNQFVFIAGGQSRVDLLAMLGGEDAEG